MTAISDLPFKQRELKVSSPLLLALYGIIPLCGLAVLIDLFFLGGTFKQALPSNPGSLIVWAVIFNFPHIVSSVITLADKEYISYYKPRFIKALKVIVAAVLFVNVLMPFTLSLFSAPPFAGIAIYGLFFIFFASYTMYHVLSQQFGIGMMMMKVRAGIMGYERWRLTATIAATLMYMLIFARPNFEAMNIGNLLGLGDVSLYQVAIFFAALFVAVSGVIGFTLSLGSNRQLGTCYVYSNILMLVATWVFLVLDYGVFVIVIPRFIHDITAFIIYSTHDHNRNREIKHNYFYRLLSFVPLSPLIICPILAITFAASLECGAYVLDFGLGFDPANSSECFLNHYYTPTVDNPLPVSMQIGIQLMFICGFFHYYIESFVWKRESIHRHSVTFS